MLSGCVSKNAWFKSCQVICFSVYDYKYLIWHNAKYEIDKEKPHTMINLVCAKVDTSPTMVESSNLLME
jgi:hypothetical protein